MNIVAKKCRKKTFNNLVSRDDSKDLSFYIRLLRTTLAWDELQKSYSSFCSSRTSPFPTLLTPLKSCLITTSKLFIQKDQIDPHHLFLQSYVSWWYGNKMHVLLTVFNTARHFLYYGENLASFSHLHIVFSDFQFGLACLKQLLTD